MVLHRGVGTLLRHVQELLDEGIAATYAELGLVDYRPRFSPVVRALVAEGPLAIRDLARAVGVTHSAASQTVAGMRRADLVRLEAGRDARQRIVHLTGRALDLLPKIEAEWAAAERAIAELDAELPVPLKNVLEEVEAALARRSFTARMAAAGT